MAGNNYQWNAADYAQHSSQQFNWACELTEKLHLRGNETVLDIGCGDGKVTANIAARLPKGRVVGIDSSPEMIELAVRQHATVGWSNLTFELMDVRHMEYAEWFDVAFSNAVLHWIKNHQHMLSRVRNALKKCGRLLFQMGGKGNADYKPPALFNFRLIDRDHPATVEPCQFSSHQAGKVAYEGSKSS